MGTAPTTQPPLSEWERRFFNLGRGPTILLIGVIVIVLAGAGLLAGALLAPSESALHRGPEGSSRLGGSGAPAISGTSVPLAPRSSRSKVALTSLPLFQVSTPTPSETVVPVGPSPSPTGPPSPGGTTVVIGPNGEVTVPVPDDWTVFGSSRTAVMEGDGHENTFYALAVQGSPNADAGALITANFSSFISSDNGYTDVTTAPNTGPKVLQPPPGTSITSLAVLSYDATLAGLQAGFPVIGNFYMAVRTDGLLLLLNPETTAVDDWDAQIQYWAPIFEGALGSFGSGGAGSG
jgi:hypothetical protein